MASRKRAGRPSRELVPGERVPMSFRVRPELKDMMDRAAVVTGRSVAQEIEIRLEQSFRDRGAVPQILEFSYGYQAANLILRVAQAMVDAGMRTILQNSESTEDFNSWPRDPAAYEKAEQAAAAVLVGFRPAPPGFADELNEATARNDSDAAERIIRRVRSNVDDTTGRGGELREQLGDPVKTAPTPARARKKKGSTQ